MQQRRGTAAQWTSANPILNAGEMGWESDTNKFKIGDGTNHWADLDYFIDQSSTVNPAFGSSITFEGATANAFETTLQVTDPTADRTITLPDSTGTVVVADGSGNVTVSGNLTVQGTTTTVDSTTINVVNSFTFEGATANAYETTLTVTDPTADRTITLPDASGTLAIEADVTSALSGKLNISGGTMTGILSMGGHKISSVAEPADNGDATTKNYVDTSVSNHTSDTTNVHGISDTSKVVITDTAQTLTSKTISSANNTITITSAEITDFTEVVQDAIGNSVGTGLSYNDTTGAVSVDTTAIQARVADVSDTEIGYLNGVTSAIQTQIDSKASSVHTHSLTDVTDVTASAAEVNILDGVTASTAELNILDGVTSSAAELNILDGATLSTTELNYVDGVTSAIQTQLDAKLALAGGTMTGAIAMGTNKITGLGDPTADQDAATKAYVDAATAGLNVHASVKAATTANITLASDVENGDTLDGVTLATGNRILVKNQTTKSQNGVYIVAASGAPTRATDYDSTPEVDAGDFIFVESGTVNGKTGWVQTNNISTIGSDNIEFTQFSGSGTYSAGTGLTLTGSTFAIDSTVSTLTGSQTLTNKTIALGSNTVSGTTAQFNSALTDGDFATLAGTETLTNKTLTSPSMTTPTVSSGTLTVSASGIVFTDGTQTKEGVPSRTPINQQSGTTYTTVLTDRDTLIECSNASAITVTVPPNSSVAYPIGTSIDILQTGAGQVTIAAGSGVTVNSTPGLKLRAQWSSATLFKRGTDTWVVMGDLSA